MGGICSRSQPRERLTPKQAIARLNEVQLMCEKRIEYLSKKQQATRAAALEKKRAGRKHEALLKLAEARRQEKSIGATFAHAQTIGQLRDSIEQAVLMSAMVDGIRSASDTLKVINERIDMDRVEKILDDAAEGIQLTQEIVDRISEFGSEVQPVSDYDQAELERELRQLEDEVGEARVAPLQFAPRPPAHEPKKEQEDEELLLLSRSMATTE